MAERLFKGPSSKRIASSADPASDCSVEDGADSFPGTTVSGCTSIKTSIEEEKYTEYNGDARHDSEELSNDEERKNADNQTARRTRRKQAAATTGHGQTRGDIVGNLQWLDADSGEWKPAIYHEEIRVQLIARVNVFGTYRFERAARTLPNDVTCFHPGQAEWGEDRNNRPEILFQYEPTRHNKGMKAPKMIYQGHLVLDYFDNPVVNYVEIPLTCSSLMEGWLQEAIVRLNPAITGRDFLARMLKDKVNVNALSMRRTRFREKAGCISWTKRAGSDNVKRYMDLILPTREFQGAISEESNDEEELGVEKTVENEIPPANAFNSEVVEKSGELEEPAIGELSDTGLKLPSSIIDLPLQNNSIVEAEEVETGEQEEEIDSEIMLYFRPITNSHRQLNYHLLEPTRREYLALLQMDPPSTDPDANYLAQYNFLQISLESEWGRRLYVGDVVPPLTRVNGITASGVVWNTAYAVYLAVDISGFLQDLFAGHVDDLISA
ncbi:hypothetical protein MMC24_005780 [Lignoscripta atroalba]|nr:hypothetical protein [Lignoscripta atroalba]